MRQVNFPGSAASLVGEALTTAGWQGQVPTDDASPAVDQPDGADQDPNSEVASTGDGSSR